MFISVVLVFGQVWVFRLQFGLIQSCLVGICWVVLCSNVMIFFWFGMCGEWMLQMFGLILFGQLNCLKVFSSFMFECEVLMVIMLVFMVVMDLIILLNLLQYMCVWIWVLLWILEVYRWKVLVVYFRQCGQVLWCSGRFLWKVVLLICMILMLVVFRLIILLWIVRVNWCVCIL